MPAPGSWRCLVLPERGLKGDEKGPKQDFHKCSGAARSNDARIARGPETQVPLGVRSWVRFHVCNDGYDNLELKYR